MQSLIFLALFAAPAPANTKPVSPELATARELQRLVFPKEQWNKMVDQMMAQMGVPPGELSKDLDPKKVKAMRAALEELVPYEEAFGWGAEIAAKELTVPEMQELMAFYKTPLGQKMMNVMPKIAGETFRKIAEVAPQRMPAVMKKHGLGQGM